MGRQWMVQKNQVLFLNRRIHVRKQMAILEEVMRAHWIRRTQIQYYRRAYQVDYYKHYRQSNSWDAPTLRVVVLQVP